MLTEEEKLHNKRRHKIMLIRTQKQNIKIIIDLLEADGFYEKPASDDYSNFPGGLCLHSLNVYDMFLKLIKYSKTFVPYSNNIIRIGCLLHQVKPTGKKTLAYISPYLNLKKDERDLIKYCWGYNGIYNGDISSIDEYNNLVKEDKYLKLMFLADEFSKHFIERKINVGEKNA